MASKLISRLYGTGASPVILRRCRSNAFWLLCRRSLLEPLTSGTTESSTVTPSNAGSLTTTEALTGPSPDKGDQVANVKTYGAVGDGVTNDTAAFNAALTSLATAGGGRCLVPKGTYLISATTNPAITSHVSSNVHLVGEGREVSILKIAGIPAGNFLFCSGDNWSVEDLTIDMQDLLHTGSRICGYRRHRQQLANSKLRNHQNRAQRNTC